MLNTKNKSGCYLKCDVGHPPSTYFPHQKVRVLLALIPVSKLISYPNKLFYSINIYRAPS